MSSPRSALVVTIVHHPADARIRHRQIQALLDAGWQVTYAAPYAAYGLVRPVGVRGLTPVDLPRSSGRLRLRALAAARRLLRERAPGHDVVLLHDPELVLATLGLDLPPVVWDVHEDTAAALEVRPWLPPLLRRPAATGVRLMERWAERRMPLLLADHHYAARFARPHPVVPNTTYVPRDPRPAATPDREGRLRVVYLGSVTMERGADEMVAVARRLRQDSGGSVVVQVIGPAHGRAGQVLEQAAHDGDLEWSGFVPNDEAVERLAGALAGLSLLHDEANFRPSMPTKVVEYMAHAVPVVTTPLPVPTELVRESGGGVVVPFHDVEQTAAQIMTWAQDPVAAAETGRRGHAAAREGFDWVTHAPGFIAALEEASRRGPSATGQSRP
ncbi:glycosyltransferase [Ornithinimicrobium avium]|uniref:Glycosyltransferase n=1 Tax=Ornithinimicrobium avium TaxID=2283195 RepID=A0A345NSS9_9MICO|nr:glycosyltransferase [Ornithinimicrobium avium]AXH98087.1 glycosyltransferase [Ornithinimicrobium avium]